MRFFEMFLAFLLAHVFLWHLLAGRNPELRPWRGVLGILTLAILLLHLLIEHYRWQMIPLYLLAAAVSIWALTLNPNPQAPAGAIRLSGIAAAQGGVILVLLAAALPVLLPVPRLPQPTGPYKVGTFSQELVDTSREELYSGRGGEPRRLMVQYWYPAEPQPGAERARWMEQLDQVIPALADWLEFPPFVLGHLRLAKANAYAQAPMATGGGPFPVILFSHGWTGFRQQNTFQAEELASHGFVVVGVQHTYAAMITVFPNGDIAPLNRRALPSGVPDDEFMAAAHKLVGQWAGDLSFVLDELEAQHASGLRAGAALIPAQLDLERVGAMGHSFGGGATVLFCAQDPRCQAALGMDAYLVPVIPQTEAGLRQPLLLLYSEAWPTERYVRLARTLHANSAGSQAFTLLGTKHYDFSDLPLLSPAAAWIGLKGPLNGSRGLRIINDFSLAFFEHSLRGEGERLAAGNYPEVIEIPR